MSDEGMKIINERMTYISLDLCILGDIKTCFKQID